MKRRYPLSHTLALLAATNMSLAPALAPLAFADIQTGTATTTTSLSGDDVVTTTAAADTTITTTTTTDTVTTPEATTTTTETTTTVTADNIASIIKSLSSTDVTQLQARYNELLDLIRAKKLEIAELTDVEDIQAAKTELTNMENLSVAFKAIIEGYADSGAKTVKKTETYIDQSSGDKVTRTTYSDGSYTETVETNTASLDSDADGFNDYTGESTGSGGGAGDFLQQMLQNPMVQNLISGLLQKLMNGGLGSLSSLLGGQNTADAGAPGKICNKQASGAVKCESSDYSSPSPRSRATPDATANTINQAVSAGAAAAQNALQGVPSELQQRSSSGNANTNTLPFGGPR